MAWDWGSCFIGIFIGALGVLVSGMLGGRKENDLSVDYCFFCKEQMCAQCEQIVNAHEDAKALEEKVQTLQRRCSQLSGENCRLLGKIFYQNQAIAR